jgi:hypothetical protein
VIAIAVMVAAFVLGAPVAGGSDSFGYVSQAHLWATGRMREELPLATELVPVVPATALVPLGYNLASDRRTMVPVYAPGLPLVMAVFELIGGGDAVFWAVPLLAGVTVLATYLLGRCAAGPLAGVIAAVLLAASPALLFQLTAAPMSDLPAAAWWSLALALLFVERAWAAPLAAFAAALAILTRPNLVPVAIVPLALVVARAVVEGRTAGARVARPRRRDLILFTAGIATACLAIAAINTRLYGSPLASGYDVRGLFGLEHAGTNLVRYPVLLTAMETPVVWLALAAPWLLLTWRRENVAVAWVAAGVMAMVFVCYLFYPGFDAHTTLRFLLPGLPGLFVLLGVTLAVAWSRLPRPWGALALVALVGWIAARGIGYAGKRGALDTTGERRYAVIGEAIAQRLPADAVILAWQHSGSVRYYAGREIVRYDLVPPQRLDRLMKRLRRLGYHPYLLLDDWEVPEFKQRFESRSVLGALDWPPAIELDYVRVRVWDLTDRARRRPPRTRTTEVLSWPFPR